MTHRALEHRARAFVALLLVAIAGLALAACGGDDGDGGGAGAADDARVVLRETFVNVRDVRSGRMRFALRMDERDGESVSLDVAGPFESKGDDYPAFDIDVDVDIASQGGLSAGLVSTSDRLFIEFDGTAYEVPSQYLDAARAQGEQQRDSLVPDLRVDTWVVDPEVVGEEEVAGVATDHVRATLDVPAFLDAVDGVLAQIARADVGGAAGEQVPSEIPADARADIEEAVRSATADVWTGADDRILRRLRVDLAIEPRGERSGTASLLLELTELDEPQTIEAPRDVRPFDELMGTLAPLLGLGAGVGGAGGGATESLDDYTRCLQDAGTDVAAAQRCASLLTR